MVVPFFQPIPQFAALEIRIRRARTFPGILDMEWTRHHVSNTFHATP